MKCPVGHSSFQSIWLTILIVGATLVFSRSFSLSTKTLRRRRNAGLKVATGLVPPQVVEESSKIAESVKIQNPKPALKSPRNEGSLAYDKDGYPRLGSLMKALPREIFEISTAKSLFYFAVDTAACVASIGFLYAVVTSDIYHSMAIWQQALTVAPLQLLAGFAMWCQWCIGHDAGHQLISKRFKWLNTAVGEIAHSGLLGRVYCDRIRRS